jgi:hypothetical protein
MPSCCFGTVDDQRLRGRKLFLAKSIDGPMDNHPLSLLEICVLTTGVSYRLTNKYLQRQQLNKCTLFCHKDLKQELSDRPGTLQVYYIFCQLHWQASSRSMRSSTKRLGETTSCSSMYVVRYSTTTNRISVLGGNTKC